MESALWGGDEEPSQINVPTGSNCHKGCKGGVKKPILVEGDMYMDQLLSSRV